MTKVSILLSLCGVIGCASGDKFLVPDSVDRVPEPQDVILTPRNQSESTRPVLVFLHGRASSATECTQALGDLADALQYVVFVRCASTKLGVRKEDNELWTDPKASAAFAVLSAGGEVIARDRLFLPFFKEMRWPRANVRVACRDGKATFTSNTFAWRVYLDLDGERKLADNFFDVYPGQPHVIAWPFRTPPKVMFVGNLV